MRASLGQKMLGLETVNAGNGATLTQQQAIRRWAFLFGPQAIVTVLQIGSSWFVYAFGLMGVLSLLLSLAGLAYTIYLLYTTSQSSKRQGFHDVQAGLQQRFGQRFGGLRQQLVFPVPSFHIGL